MIHGFIDRVFEHRALEHLYFALVTDVRKVDRRVCVELHLVYYPTTHDILCDEKAALRTREIVIYDHTALNELFEITLFSFRIC